MRLQSEVRYKDENFIVGNGTIVTKNICIPLNAISIIKIEGKNKRPLGKTIITIIIGFILTLIPVIGLIGTIAFYYGLIKLVYLIIVNCLKKFGLVIQVHSGTSYVFEHKDIDFIRKIADVIRKGLDDTSSVTYISMGDSKIEHNFHGNPSFFVFGDGNTFGDMVMGGQNNITKQDSHTSYDSHDTINSNNTTNIFSSEEWEKMEQYFQLRAEQLGRSSEAYKPCKRMEQYAKQKDAHRLRQFMKTIGKPMLRVIVEKATEYGIGALFQKLASAVI